MRGDNAAALVAHLRGKARRYRELALSSREAPSRRGGRGWQVVLYERLPSGKPGRHTFDILSFHTKKEALAAARNHQGDRRFVPVVERETERAGTSGLYE